MERFTLVLSAFMAIEVQPNYSAFEITFNSDLPVLGLLLPGLFVKISKQVFPIECLNEFQISNMPAQSASTLFLGVRHATAPKQEHQGILLKLTNMYDADLTYIAFDSSGSN